MEPDPPLGELGSYDVKFELGEVMLVHDVMLVHNEESMDVSMDGPPGFDVVVAKTALTADMVSPPRVYPGPPGFEDRVCHDVSPLDVENEVPDVTA